MHRKARGGEPRSSSLRAALVAVCLVVALPTAALAQEDDSPAEAVKRLEGCSYLVKRFDRGADTLVEDIVASVKQFDAPSDELIDLRDGHWLWRGKELSQREADLGAEVRAFDYLSELHSNGRTDTSRKDAVPLLVSIWVRRGERHETGGDDKSALEAYKSAIELDRTNRAPYASLGSLSSRVAKGYADVDAFDDALQELTETRTTIAREFGEGDPTATKLSREIERIESTTGKLTFRWLGNKQELADGVRGEVVDYTSAVLGFTPVSGHRAPRDVNVVPGTDIRVRSGSFRVKAQGSGGIPLVFDLTIPNEGAEVLLPSVIPAGMVYVPASDKLDAFLIDRTEVSAGTFKEFAAETAVEWLAEDPDDFPARGFSFETAGRYAAWAGKELPDLAEWLRAALETPDGRQRTYPWGEELGVKGEHVTVLASKPDTVTSCAAGASAFGALNMGGNVAEWLDNDGHGWVIGGSFSSRNTKLEMPVYKVDGYEEWSAALLREPFPTVEAHAANRAPKDRSYYPPSKRIGPANYKTIGVRCVVHLGPKREMP